MTTQTDITNIVTDVLEYSRSQDYTGYDKGDGMSALPIRLAPFDNKWFNIVIQETIKRAPVNIRPIFGVPQKRNFKGVSLFAVANKNMYEVLGNDYYLNEAISLADWLIDNQSKEYDGFCGAYQHPVQNLSQKIPAGTPGIVNTSYGVQALIKLSNFKPEYTDQAESALNFLINDLDYNEISNGARVKYKANDPSDFYTLNANALAARLLLDIYSVSEENVQLAMARKILQYVATNQESVGGWMYRDPPSASHVSMDTYHNGFIIESFLRYRQITGSKEFNGVIDSSMDFYRNELFENSGAPNWDESNEYPKDIHAAATGVVTFAIAEDYEFAQKIAEWMIDTLYAGDGRFYYQKTNIYTKKFTFMRWCQGWTAYALSELLYQKSE